MYRPIAFLPPRVRYDNPWIVELAAHHHALAGAAGALVDPVDRAGAPTRFHAEPAATEVGDHGVLNAFIDDGWVRAGADQAHLSVEQQLEPDGTIRGHIDSGVRSSNGNPPGEVNPSPSPIDHKPDPLVPDLQIDQAIDTWRTLQANPPQLPARVLPMDAITSAVAADAGAAIFRKIGGPARIDAMSDQLDTLTQTIDQIRSRQGPAGVPGVPGEPGPIGPAGPPGPPGADAPPVVIVL